MQIAHLLFVLYKPSAGNAWDLAGSASRTAVGLGLHHESTHAKLPLDEEMGRRLFWIQLPSIYDDSLITDTAVTPEEEPSPLKAASLQVYGLRRIQCEVLTRLHTSSAPPSNIWYQSVVEKLAQWRVICPEGAGYANADWLTLHYHATLTMLYRPSRANPKPDRPTITKALASSREVLRRSKDMYRIGRVNFNRQNGWNLVPSYVDALLDIHVCSSLMEGLAAITPGTSGIRNAFEAVSGEMIQQLTSASIPKSTDPLAIFFVHPLGEMSGDEWEKTVGVALRLLL
ncbi:uncharacterized protein IL334_001207 [Kwoniella shivajii]|uniref:Transcription factor domain-containing protein n=1 Tax=Kwoniella shivajii TaxID=564305 RepID=A0ABZ1CRJ2_9TREE|nr:hypothetical protein IL334_001207 [Kwoniella shivajii]